MSLFEISFNTSKRDVKTDLELDEDENLNEMAYNTPKIKNVNLSQSIHSSKNSIKIENKLLKNSKLKYNEKDFSFNLNTNESVSKLNSLSTNEFTFSLNPSTPEFKSITQDKLNYINELNSQINNEISKIVICKECKRKFANKGHYIRHITLSEFHKSNENKGN